MSRAWLERLPETRSCNLAVALERFGELREAIAPPTYSVCVNEGFVAEDVDSGDLEADIDAYLLPPGMELPVDEDERDRLCGRIELELDTRTRELRLGVLDIPEEAQTNGLGSIVIDQLAGLGEDLGLGSMCLEAGNVGRWAWMRCGFDFEDPRSRAAVLGAAAGFARALGSEVELGAIEHTWELVDLPGTVTAREVLEAGGAAIRSVRRPISLGKALVLGPPPSANPWWGRLSLEAGSEGVVRLREYVASRGNED
jgi:hypothetical protein